MKYNYTILLLLSIAVIFGCNEENPGSDQALSFIKFYGSSMDNFGNDIKQLNDGSYILIGTTETENNGMDIYLAKIDEYGNKEWEKRYGNKNNEEGNCIQLLDNGGFVFCGTQIDTAAGSNIILIKTDADGNTVDSMLIGDPNSYESGNYFKITETGDFLIVGSTTDGAANINENHDIYMARAGSAFDTVLSRSIPITGFDELTFVENIPDGNYIAIGSTSWNSNTKQIDILCLEIDENLLAGNIGTFGGNLNDYGTSAKYLDDGTMLLLGYSEENPNNVMDIYLAKILLANLTQSPMWTRYIGGNNDDYAYKMNLTMDNEIIIAGSSNSIGSGNDDFYLVKTDTSGNVLNQEAYGFTGNESANAVIQCDDNGYLLIGSSSIEENSMIAIIKTYPDLALVKN
mgnify:CR=1 FL=1